MKTTQVDPDGTVRCPNCGATSFVEKRTGKAKWGVAATGIATFGVGALVGIAAAPKRLKCNGCGTNLRRSGGGTLSRHYSDANVDPARPASDPPGGTEQLRSGPTPGERIDTWTADIQAKNEQVKNDIAYAKTREVGYLPEGVHPKSIRARQIRRAQEKTARTAPTEAGDVTRSENQQISDTDRRN